MTETESLYCFELPIFVHFENRLKAEFYFWYFASRQKRPLYCIYNPIVLARSKKEDLVIVFILVVLSAIKVEPFDFISENPWINIFCQQDREMEFSYDFIMS